MTTLHMVIVGVLFGLFSLALAAGHLLRGSYFWMAVSIACAVVNFATCVVWLRSWRLGVPPFWRVK